MYMKVFPHGKGDGDMPTMNSILSFPVWTWQAAGSLTHARPAGRKILTYSVISTTTGKAGHALMTPPEPEQERRIMPTCTRQG